MAKNSQMRTILLCGGILLVVLFFLGVFKMKEGFQTVPCSYRNSESCSGGKNCSWNSTTKKCALSEPCSKLTQPVCAANNDVCKWNLKNWETGESANCSNI